MTSCAEITTAMSSYDHSRVTVLYTMPLLCRKQIKIPCKTLSMKSCKNNQTKTNSQIVAPIGHINWPGHLMLAQTLKHICSTTRLLDLQTPNAIGIKMNLKSLLTCSKVWYMLPNTRSHNVY